MNKHNTINTHSHNSQTIVGVNVMPRGVGCGWNQHTPPMTEEQMRLNKERLQKEIAAQGVGVPHVYR